jgi:hypothetical protein
MNIFVFFSFLRHFPIFSPMLPIFSFSDPPRYFAVADVGNSRSCLNSRDTQLNMSTTYHPQMDGQTEVVNKCLETYLRCFSSERQHQWAQWLPLTEWWYNTTYHGSTKMTPYEVVYGQNPPSMVSYLLGTSKVQVVDHMLHTREAILCTLKDNLVMAQNHMKQQVNQQSI